MEQKLAVAAVDFGDALSRVAKTDTFLRALRPGPQTWAIIANLKMQSSAFDPAQHINSTRS